MVRREECTQIVAQDERTRATRQFRGEINRKSPADRQAEAAASLGSSRLGVSQFDATFTNWHGRK